MASNIPGAPDPTNPIEGTKPVNPQDPNAPSTGSKSFSSFMEGNDQEGQTKAVSPSPAQVQANPALTQTPSLDTIHTQMKAASSSLGDLQSKLNTPKLKLKPSQKYLLRNKLSEMHSQIRDASAKLGIDVGKAPGGFGRGNPIGRFLNMIDDSQKQMSSAQAHIASMTERRATMKPADLLLVQVKLAKAQQEIDYSSVLLSKAIDDIKMLFNVQM